MEVAAAGHLSGCEAIDRVFDGITGLGHKSEARKIDQKPDKKGQH